MDYDIGSLGEDNDRMAELRAVIARDDAGPQAALAHIKGPIRAI